MLHKDAPSTAPGVRESAARDVSGAPSAASSAAEKSLIDDLEDAIAHTDLRHRATVMRRLTDLFIMNGEGFSEEHIAMFDEVMSRLVTAIDSSARAEFGDLIAKSPKAPIKTTRLLALDDEIKVAGPILSHSRALDEATLIEGAKTKSQDHLYAISLRETIGEAVTDILVERGDTEVVRSTGIRPYHAGDALTGGRRARTAHLVSLRHSAAASVEPVRRRLPRGATAARKRRPAEGPALPLPGRAG
jgi:hypothetical protein